MSCVKICDDFEGKFVRLSDRNEEMKLRLKVCTDKMIFAFILKMKNNISKTKIQKF